MKKSYLYLIMFFFLAGCAMQRQANVTHIKSMADLGKTHAVYALPLTVLEITIEATRKTVIPGPFHEYAEKYLGIQNVPDSESVEWTISDVRVDVYDEADPDYYYSVSNNAGTLDKMLEYLEENRLIKSPGHFYSIYSISELDTSHRDEILYRDLSVRRNLYTGYDTVYKRTFVDSAFVIMPVIKKILVKKTIEEKAEEAANYIIKIRKRRFKLVSGQYEQVPDGQAMDIAVAELDATENEYLSLFTGKAFTDRFTRTFRYVPDGSRQLSKEVLCRFSGTEGFVDPKGVKGIPVILEAEDMNMTMHLEDIGSTYQQPVTGTNMPVRLPDMAEIRIIRGSGIISKSRMPVFQYGILIPFSSKN
jgi:hypothetical protein